jgi:argininosuccinate lyase
LKAQLGLTHVIGWADLAHTMCLAEQGVIPRDNARALIAALLELHAAPLSFAPTAEYGDLYTNREAWLAARTPAVGWLGVARARREALTTAYHLTLCDEILSLGEALATATEALRQHVLAAQGQLDARLHISAGGPTNDVRPLSPVLCLANVA